MLLNPNGRADPKRQKKLFISNILFAFVFHGIVCVSWCQDRVPTLALRHGQCLFVIYKKVSFLPFSFWGFHVRDGWLVGFTARRCNLQRSPQRSEGGFLNNTIERISNEKYEKCSKVRPFDRFQFRTCLAIQRKSFDFSSKKTRRIENVILEIDVVDRLSHV